MTGVWPFTGRRDAIAHAVALAARGQTDAAIAAVLQVSIRTVQSHLEHAYAKLGVSRRTDLPAVLRG